MVGSDLRSIVFGAAVLCSGATAFAQERPGSVYATGGIDLSHQAGPSGESPQTYVTAPGGNTRGWFIGGGVFVASAMSVEFELSSTGVMAARQPSRYGMTFNEERRDRFVSLAARFHLPQVARFRIEPVVGMVVTNPEAWSQTEYYMYWQTPQQLLVEGPRLQHRLDTKLGLTFGCDVRIGGGHVALLPSFRMSDTGVSHGFYDDSSDHREIEAIYPGGYPKWTLRSGVAVRVDFSAGR
jgi:hypothetical protein